MKRKQKQAKSLFEVGNRPCGCRAQATVEFILTLVIALLIISAIVLPSYENSSNYVIDVSNLAKLRVSADKLVDAIQYVYVSGNGTKQTILAVVPQSSSIECTPNAPSTQVTMTYVLLSKQSIPACLVDADPSNGQSCKKIFSPGNGLSFTCSPTTLQQGLYNVVVSKDLGAITVVGTKIG